MDNIVTFKIDNCMKCPFHFVDKIFTDDSWNHEEGCYCKKSDNKLVGADDWHLEEYTKIPDWCPLLNKENIL